MCMRAVIQRVSSASVVVNQAVHAGINHGFLVLLGIEQDDAESDAIWLADKISQMRVFQDAEDKMNLSLREIDGSILVVSQFTLHASCKKGNRPRSTSAS